MATSSKNGGNRLLTELHGACTISDMKAIFDRAFDAAGGLSTLAAAISQSPQTVSNWRERGVPAAHCPAIEKATGGAVTCEELRPDLTWSRIPDKSWPNKKGRPVLDFAKAAA